MRWIRQQLEVERTVIIPKFLIISEGSVVGENEKHLVVQLHETFRFANNISQSKNLVVEQKYSSVKINF